MKNLKDRSLGSIEDNKNVKTGKSINVSDYANLKNTDVVVNNTDEIKAKKRKNAVKRHMANVVKAENEYKLEQEEINALNNFETNETYLKNITYYDESSVDEASKNETSKDDSKCEFSEVATNDSIEVAKTKEPETKQNIEETISTATTYSYANDYETYSKPTIDASETEITGILSSEQNLEKPRVIDNEVIEKIGLTENKTSKLTDSSKANVIDENTSNSKLHNFENTNVKLERNSLKYLKTSNKHNVSFKNVVDDIEVLNNTESKVHENSMLIEDKTYSSTIVENKTNSTKYVQKKFNENKENIKITENKAIEPTLTENRTISKITENKDIKPTLTENRTISKINENKDIKPTLIENMSLSKISKNKIMDLNSINVEHKIDIKSSEVKTFEPIFDKNLSKITENKTIKFKISDTKNFNNFKAEKNQNLIYQKNTKFIEVKKQPINVEKTRNSTRNTHFNFKQHKANYNDTKTGNTYEKSIKNIVNENLAKSKISNKPRKQKSIQKFMITNIDDEEHHKSYNFSEISNKNELFEKSTNNSKLVDVLEITENIPTADIKKKAVKVANRKIFEDSKKPFVPDKNPLKTESLEPLKTNSKIFESSKQNNFLTNDNKLKSSDIKFDSKYLKDEKTVEQPKIIRDTGLKNSKSDKKSTKKPLKHSKMATYIKSNVSENLKNSPKVMLESSAKSTDYKTDEESESGRSLLNTSIESVKEVKFIVEKNHLNLKNRTQHNVSLEKNVSNVQNERKFNQGKQIKNKSPTNFAQKRRNKRVYANKIYKQKFKNLTKENLKKFNQVAIKITKKVATNPVFIVVCLIIVLCTVVAVNVSTLFQATTGVISSSYASDDSDILEINTYYTGLENALKDEINDIELDYPDYDEYVYELVEISHSPYELISYLSAKYNTCTLETAKAELDRIFNLQYELKTESLTETRIDDYGNEYDHTILKVILTAKSLKSIIEDELTDEQLELYNLYMESGGNRPDLFDDNLFSQNGNGQFTDYEIPSHHLTNSDFRNLITEAEKYLGYPYVFGGSTPSTSFDCSGFVCWVLRESGVMNISRTTAQGVFNQTTPISPSQATAGDIIYFTGTYNTANAVSHIGIYVGDGMMIHCGDPISYASINSSYWQSHFYAFGRIPNN